jgi:septum formation protein
MNQNRPIVLASSSIYRRQQLEQLGIHFACIHPDIDETPRPDERPQDLALRLAIAKATKVLASYPDALVIGSDQVAELGQVALGKPRTEANALKQLTACANREVTFYTGVCIASRAKTLARWVPTTVKFLPLSQAALREYIQREMPLDCAGSFKCEGLGIALFESITSSDPSALVGLPLISVNLMLAELGYHIFDARSA